MNLVWFRNDLRTADNPALFYAMSNKSSSVIAVYLLCQEESKNYGIGNNQIALQLHALSHLKENLKQLNVPLLIINAKNFQSSPATLLKVCQAFSVKQLFFNIEYPINERSRDQKVIDLLKDKLDCHRFNSDSLTPHWKIVNKEDSGYKVFTPYANKVRAYLDQNPIITLPAIDKKPIDNQDIIKTTRLETINVINELPEVKITSKKIPEISSHHLIKQLKSFCQNSVSNYSDTRDFPAIQGTSELSAGLALGCLSVQRCYQEAIQHSQPSTWVNELIWRDFYRSVMWHYPDVCKGHAFNPVDKNINWSGTKKDIEEWQQAKTGIPIIDAAMRQLLDTGWMHNRLRMIVASYLTKNLWQDWRKGEAFFAKHLFDYDFASNNGGWQWSASIGTDAAPYFRVFNPASQQKKFDPDCEFIKHWLPELKNYSAKQIHNFEKENLADYPAPQVDLKTSRKLSIEQFKLAKNTEN